MIRIARALLAAAGAATLATATVSAAEAAREPATITDPRGADAAMMARRVALLQQAEAELARGATSASIESFERAAMMLHAPDTEMGLVRAQLQAGRYAQALAFAAHTAGAHLESGAAGALYAWLLRVGGQTAASDRVLRETLQRLPDDPVVLAVRRAFDSPVPLASGLLLEPPQRVAPWPVMLAETAAVPADAELVSSAVLIRGGTHALLPGASLGALPPKQLWVRNGLGHTTRASVEPMPTGPGSEQLTLLRLAVPLEAPDADTAVLREPFAGSVGFAVEYAATSRADAAGPWLRQGFFGSFIGSAGLRRVGIELAPGPHGGPVFDAAGRLVGIVLPAPDGRAAMLTLSPWLPAGPVTNVPASRPGVASLDGVYEQALRRALQVIAVR